MRIQKIGMRNIKTGIGVFLSVLAGRVGFIENPFFTAAASLDSIKNTVKGSVETGWHRVVGTVLGGIFGFIFGSYYNDILFMPALGVCMIIYLCNILKINNSINMALVTFLSITLSLDKNSNIFEYSVIRTWDTSVGVIIGLSVNYFLQRSNYIKTIVKDIVREKNDFFKLVERSIAENKDIDLYDIENKINKFEELYKKLVLEVEYSNKRMELNGYKYSLYACKNIKLHLNAIKLIEGEVTITQENYNEIKRIWPNTCIDRPIAEGKHPVFNYHVKMILKEIEKELYC